MFLHASRLPEYRTPFGALPTDSEVTLRFKTDLDSTDIILCYSYGLYEFSYHEEPMNYKASEEDCKLYEVSLKMPFEAGLIFYWFKFKKDGEMLYYVSDGNVRDGVGKVYSEPPRIGVEEEKYPYAWQITVYDKDFKTPDCFKGSVFYQIFPDRFARDAGFSFEKMCNASPRDERIYHEDWNEDVDIEGKPETGYLACDFFGGSIKGIEEKLSYIKSLGVDTIYLNPIFEARSGHRYDTADYLNVDPILGDNDAFISLASKAKELGIKIVLDGVFSHTGADSRYFNKFDRYDGVGAYKAYLTGEESKYRSWYSFNEDEEGNLSYASWWGFPDLPNVDENDLSYRNFVFGKNGVVDTWMRRGASGIRLDVSDELPDSFIRQMRKCVKENTDGEGIVIGEVWEDASNKCSYGSYRDFLLGRTHDSVMGYTFREGLLKFLTNEMNAQTYEAYLEGFRERYPSESYYCIMNLISSHDVPRALTMLAGKPDPGDRVLQKDVFLDSEERVTGLKLMKMALALQIGYIGAPCIYYGDEVMSEGYRDPFNRRTYPWDNVSSDGKELLEFTRKLTALRQNNTCLKTGFYKTVYAFDSIFAFERSLDASRKDFFGNESVKGYDKILLLVNNSRIDACHLSEKNGKLSILPVPMDENVKQSSYLAERGSTEIFDSYIEPLSFVFILY